MVERRPVKIRDKNGKDTTVYRRVDDPTSVIRVNKTTGIPRSAEMAHRYPDDLNDSFNEVNRLIGGHPANIKQIIDLDVAREDSKLFDRHTEMKAIYENARELWQITTDNADSLADVKTEFRDSIIQIMKATNPSDGALGAYETLLKNIDLLDPIADGEDYIPRRGRRDISDNEKSNIASLVDVGGIAIRNLVPFGKGEKENVSTIKAVNLGIAINDIAVWNKKMLSNEDVDDLAAEFFGDQLEDRLSQLEMAGGELTVNHSDLRDFLVEIAVMKGIA